MILPMQRIRKGGWEILTYPWNPTLRPTTKPGLQNATNVCHIKNTDGSVYDWGCSGPKEKYNPIRTMIADCAKRQLYAIPSSLRPFHDVISVYSGIEEREMSDRSGQLVRMRTFPPDPTIIEMRRAVKGHRFPHTLNVYVANNPDDNLDIDRCVCEVGRAGLIGLDAVTPYDEHGKYNSVTVRDRCMRVRD